MTLTSLLLVTLLAGPVDASEIEVTRYAPLREMSLEAASVRQDMEQALLAVSVGQARVKQAKEEMQEVASARGIHSADYEMARARFSAVQRQTLTRILDQLERSQSRLDDASRRTGGHVDKLLSSRTTFEALVRGQLKNQRNPESTALILHMAVKKLENRCQDLYAQVLVGQLDADLSDIEETLRLLGDLGTGTGTGSATLEEMWSRFSGASNPLAPSEDSTLDDLDRMLQ